MEFQLLFNLDVVSDFCLILLQLLLVLLGRQVNRLKCGRELRGSHLAKATAVLSTIVGSLFVVIEFHGHKDLNLCLNIVKHHEAV